jgi:Acetyltransferase (GNAT) domain
VQVGEAAWHATPLDIPVDELYRCDSARRNIATSERKGVHVDAITGFDAVRTYHRLHVSLRKRKYRLLAQPFALFERIWDEFSVSDGIVTFLAHVNGDPIAGGIYLVWNDVSCGTTFCTTSCTTSSVRR